MGRHVLLLVALLSSPSGSSAAEPLWTEGKNEAAISGPVDAQAFARLVRQVAPAVVNISSTPRSGTPRRSREELYGRNVGTGFVIRKDGLVLTNYHVVEDAEDMRIRSHDQRDFAARIVGWDRRTDLALLRIEDEGPFTAVPLGDSNRVEIGEWVVAIGNALGLTGGPTVTVGVVSAVGRSITEPDGIALHDLIQTDAAINPGNSGGPLINLRGEVVGVNTAIAGGSEGIGFAVSMSTAKPVVQELLIKGEVAWPWMGVSVESVTPGLATEGKLPVDEGVILRGVQRDGPADRAGMVVGDIVVRLDGRQVANVRQLQEAVRAHKIGDIVEVSFLRGGAEQKASVTLEKMPRS